MLSPYYYWFSRYVHFKVKKLLFKVDFSLEEVSKNRKIIFVCEFSKWLLGSYCWYLSMSQEPLDRNSSFASLSNNSLNSQTLRK